MDIDWTTYLLTNFLLSAMVTAFAAMIINSDLLLSKSANSICFLNAKSNSMKQTENFMLSPKRIAKRMTQLEKVDEIPQSDDSESDSDNNYRIVQSKSISDSASKNVSTDSSNNDHNEKFKESQTLVDHVRGRENTNIIVRVKPNSARKYVIRTTPTSLKVARDSTRFRKITFKSERMENFVVRLLSRCPSELTDPSQIACSFSINDRRVSGGAEVEPGTTRRLMINDALFEDSDEDANLEDAQPKKRTLFGKSSAKVAPITRVQLTYSSENGLLLHFDGRARIVMKPEDARYFSLEGIYIDNAQSVTITYTV